MAKYVAAIDQGTTSTRVILFDKAGRIAAAAQKEHKQHFPRAAWVEHDADEIWEKVEMCVREALAAAGATPSDLASVGITNQRETVVVWDAETGKPYYHALVWQDQRGAPMCDELSAKPGVVEAIKTKTGLPVVPYFSATKLAWMLTHVEGLREAAEAGKALAGTIDTFLLWRLTGVHATDVSNASRTLLCDIRTLAWDAELCATFGIPTRMLPAIKPSVCKFGVCKPTSVLPGVVVGGILGDQQAALFGQTCFEPGEAKNTYGTGCFLLMNTGTTPVPSTHGLLTTVAYQIGEGGAPVYALEGSVAVAGAVVTWLRDNLQIISGSHEVEAVARSVPDNGGLVFVPAFNGLFAPHWRSDARGVLVGLSGHTRRGHIARAALEAVAFQTRDLLEAMHKDMTGGAAAGAASSGPAPRLRVDGGMTANSLLMQFQADIGGRAVVRPAVAETTALGAAYAAGLATGFWSSLEELRAQWRVDAEWKPTLHPTHVASLSRAWNEGLKRTLGWAHVEAGAADGTTASAPASPAATPLPDTPATGGASTAAGAAAAAAATAAAPVAVTCAAPADAAASKPPSEAEKLWNTGVTLAAGAVMGIALLHMGAHMRASWRR